MKIVFDEISNSNAFYMRKRQLLNEESALLRTVLLCTKANHTSLLQYCQKSVGLQYKAVTFTSRLLEIHLQYQQSKFETIATQLNGTFKVKLV